MPKQDDTPQGVGDSFLNMVILVLTLVLFALVMTAGIKAFFDFAPENQVDDVPRLYYPTDPEQVY